MLNGAAVLSLFIALGIVSQSSEALGCYALQPYEWSRSLTTLEATLHTPPDTFRLYAMQGPEEVGPGNWFEAGRMLVRPRKTQPSWGGSGTPQAYWTQRGLDSLEVVWTNGFTGARIAAAGRGGQLSGRLEWIADAVGLNPNPHARVILVRVRCPMSLPDTIPQT